MNKNSCFVTFFLVSLCVLLNGCRPYQKLESLIYFQQKGDSLQIRSLKTLDAIIQPGDRVNIVVSALNAESVVPYNLIASGNATTASGGGYLVDNDGYIHFPQLGKKKVAGLTRPQLINILTNDLVLYVNDPIVTVQFTNYKVTILGEVGRPGSLTIPDGKLNIVEALGQAGDSTNFSNRSNIMVIREVDGKKEFGHINMLSRNVFNSPYYYLKQNDIIYVEPTQLKIQNDQTFMRNVSLVTTVISVISTMVLLILKYIKIKIWLIIVKLL